jgi:hypothetical protein
MFRRGLPVVLAEILPRIPMNVIDRFISVFVGYGIAMGIGGVIANEKRKGKKEKSGYQITGNR